MSLLFSVEQFRIAWNQCRKYNYLNYYNFGLLDEIKFYDNHIETIIADILKRINTKTYEFSCKYVTYIPKSNKLLRRIAIVPLEDQLVMQVILNNIGKQIDKSFIHFSYGNRIEYKKGKLSTVIFRPYYNQFNKFNNKLINSIKNTTAWVCETDITAYFDTINHNRLEILLNTNIRMNNLELKKYVIELIMKFIKTDIIEGKSKRKCVRGIPQSNALSAFLGNLYLNEIDHLMEKNKNIIFIRYVDDIKIIGKTQKDVINALLDLQKELLICDLYVNSSKTKIYEVNGREIDKNKLIQIQKSKLSIERISEKDLLEKFTYETSKMNQESTEELNELVNKKNTMLKHMLIKTNKNQFFGYLRDYILNVPKYYYLVQNLKKYRNKIDKESILTLYKKIIISPYDIIAAYGIAEILENKNFYKIEYDINKIKGDRLVAILLQLITNQEYLKSLINLEILKTENINIIVKEIVIALSKIKNADKWKRKIVDYLLQNDFLCKDSYLLIYVLLEQYIDSEKVKKIVSENYPCTFKSLSSKNIIDKEKNFYKSLKMYDCDLYSIKSIIIAIFENLPVMYKSNPSYINPYNIDIEFEDDIIIKFSDNPYVMINKLPEDFIGRESSNEKKISYMIGILWFCTFLNESMKMYDEIVPYIQFSASNYYRKKKNNFIKRYSNTKEKVLKKMLNNIDRLIRKNPSSRLDIVKILKINTKSSNIKSNKEDKIMNKNDNYNIMHISDIHFGIERNEMIDEVKIAQRKLVLENRLIDKLKTLNEEWKPNVLVISGDIGWSGKNDDYLKAEEWLKKIINVLGIDEKHLIICPGNHDLNREEAEGVVRTTKTDYESADNYLSKPNVRNKLEACFVEYQQFAQKIGITPYVCGTTKGYLCGVTIVDNIKYVVLNSAWFSRDNNDKNNLWIGLPMLEIMEASEQIGKDDYKSICIGVMHHPNNWLAESEMESYGTRTSTYDYFADVTQFILSGHVHANLKKSGKVNGSNLISAGSLYTEEQYKNNCSIIKLNFDNNTFDRTVLEYRPDQREWQIIYDYEKDKLIREKG